MTEPATTVLAPVAQPDDDVPQEPANTVDARRPLSVAARKRVAHRLVAIELNDRLASDEGFNVDTYTEADQEAILDLVEQITRDHERRSF